MQTFEQRYMPVAWDANATHKELPWFVPGWWIRNGINLILGPEKSGKSRFLGWVLARMLAYPDGWPVLYDSSGNIMASHDGFKRILYLNAEEQTVDVMSRINAYARKLGFEPKDSWPIECVAASGMQLHTRNERLLFEKTFLANNKFDIVICDPLRRVHAGNENDNSAMAPLHNDIRRWTQQLGQTWFLVHHSPKFRDEDDLDRIATWCRGNTDLASLADTATMMRTLSRGKDKGQMLRSVKRDGRIPPQDDLVLLDYGEPNGFAVRG